MMNTPSSRFVARLLWAVPAFLLLLAVHQVWTAYALRRTLRQGTRARAEVMKVEISNRVDVTYDYVNLRVYLPDGGVMERKKLSLPHSLIPLLEGKETIAVRVLPDAPKEIVIASIGRSQWHIAAIQSAIAAVAALLFGAGVFAWNRYLKREGDPAFRRGGEEERAEG